MKTFFKRTAAAATGSVLALTQLAATAVVNVSAAESKTWDKAWVIDVPVEETVKSTAIVDGDTVKEITESVVAGESQWNSDFEAAILAIAGTDDVSTTAATTAAKNFVKRQLTSTSYVDAETAQELVDAVSGTANIVVGDGTAKITLDVAECGEAVGQVIENVLTKRGGVSLLDDAGNKIAIDWSAFKVSGQIIVDVTYDYSKNVSYAVTFVDEKGTSYTADKAFDYAEKKLAEASAVISASAAKVAASYGITDFTLEMTQFETRAANATAKAKKTIAAMYGVSVSGTELEATYADYLAAEKAAVGTRVANQIEKRAPKSIEGVLTNEKVLTNADNIIASLTDLAGEKQSINIAAADLSDIILSGYDYDIQIPNGASADLVFSIEDDQNADVLAALQAIDPEVVSVESHKEVTLNVDNKLDGTGNLYYNVVRVIDVITKTTTTTTESTETTTSSTESTTSSTESTTSSTESTTSSTESTTSSTESTTSSTESTTSSTESTTSSTESTTSSTETTPVSFSAEYVANGANIAMGTIIVKPKQKWVKDMLEVYERSHFVKGKKFDEDPNSIKMTAYLKKRYGLKIDGTEQFLGDGIRVVTRDYFCAKDFTTGETQKTENTYAIHLYDSTWLSTDCFLYKFLRGVRKLVGRKGFDGLTRFYTGLKVKTLEKLY